MESIKITWLGHACFIIEADSYRILIDPYKNGYVCGYNIHPVDVNEVICSHEHTDHNFRNIANILPPRKSPFDITVINTYHDNAKGKLRGTNKIHIFTAFGIKVVHFGDIGCNITAKEEKQLLNAHAVMIPTGGTYTISAKQANDIVNRISPNTIIPMHYRTDKFGFDELEHIDDFAALRNDVTFSDKNSIEITSDTRYGCVVLKYIDEK